MTTPGNVTTTSHLWRLRANWPALLLPLVTLGALSATRDLTGLSAAVILAAVLLAALTPEIGAKAAPFALFGYGGYGIFLMHSLLAYETESAFYGFVHVTRTGDPSWLGHLAMGLVLTQAAIFIPAGVGLLALTGAPGGMAVRRAAAQLRGTGGLPRTVPPLLLLPVIFLWEELFGQHLWFANPSQPGITPLMLAGMLIFAVGGAAVVWLPRVAAVLAVAGIAIFGLVGVALGLLWVFHPGLAAPGPFDGESVGFYGAAPLDGGITELAAALQGAALVAVGVVLSPRLLTWSADFELAERVRALSRRVDGLTRSRSDATEAAVAELRRIERDLHDGAQARLVAVGMSLRAVEQLIGTNPDAARALVAEARETSSRALADLRDLVRGIYPPVLADRGLAEAVRNLALDTLIDVTVSVDLAGEPPMPVAAAVYFAVAEGLANAVRHAGADAVQVSISHEGDLLRAAITDDGRGGADTARGTGLAGVERRLATFDGILAVSSPPGGPTIVAIEVPCALSSVKISSC